jgi:hypothetical protein
MKALDNIIGKINGFEFRRGYWMLERECLQFALCSNKDEKIQCQAGIRDPFAKSESEPLFVEVITLVGSRAITNVSLPWKNGDVTALAKKVIFDGEMESLFCRWAATPRSFVDFATLLIGDWEKNVFAKSHGLFARFNRRSMEVPPLCDYVLSLLYFHSGNAEKSCYHLDKFRAMLAPDEHDQLEWRNAHRQTLKR